MSGLMALAILPGIFLVSKIWKLDGIEKEPSELLVRIIFLGAGVAIPVIFIELAMNSLELSFFSEGSLAFLLVDNFIGVALVEEVGKFLVTKKVTWKDENFDYVFDGIVYAVCASMGFAILENIFYVCQGGVSTAFFRAISAMPGHCVYGIFMGHYYGLAKKAESNGDFTDMNNNLLLSILVPTILHGFYDFCLCAENDILYVVVLIFIVVLYTIAFSKVKKYAKEDERLVAYTAYFAEDGSMYIQAKDDSSNNSKVYDK